jgi:anti-sigma B factor antagonist
VNIQERMVGSVVVLDLSGRVAVGENDGGLKDKVNSVIFQGNHHILLNLADVVYIDSNGLGELVSSFSAVAKRGGQIKLVNLTKRVEDLLAICRLLTVFDTYEDEAAAIASFPERAQM